MPKIRKMLDLSTAHLPKRLGEDGLSGVDGVTAYEIDHGWLVWVPNDPDESADWYRDGNGHLEPDFELVLTIQRYARAADCDYIQFDSDADIDPDLPSWDW